MSDDEYVCPIVDVNVNNNQIYDWTRIILIIIIGIIIIWILVKQ